MSAGRGARAIGGEAARKIGREIGGEAGREIGGEVGRARVGILVGGARVGGALRGLVLGLALAGLITGCVVHRLMGPRLTGTCEGACAHYLECKPGATDRDRDRCRTECPDVFSDRDSLMAYESLSCVNAVEYVDGTPPKTVVSPR